MGVPPPAASTRPEGAASASGVLKVMVKRSVKKPDFFADLFTITAAPVNYFNGLLERIGVNVWCVDLTNAMKLF